MTITFENPERSSLPERFLRIAALWLLVCVVLGAYMGAAHDHLDKQIHVHGNLLGWATCALFAACHRLWPALSQSRAAGVHFWMHNVGLLSLVFGLALAARGHALAPPLLGAGALLLVIGTGLFLALVWKATGRAAMGMAPRQS